MSIYENHIAALRSTEAMLSDAPLKDGKTEADRETAMRQVRFQIWSLEQMTEAEREVYGTGPTHEAARDIFRRCLDGELTLIEAEIAFAMLEAEHDLD